MKTDIYIAGEINEEAFVSFSKKLAYQERAAKSNKTVNVMLMSSGGDADVALAFLDRMESSHLEICVTATGYVASAAIMILAAGDKRRMTKSSWAMVHEEAIEGLDGDKVSSLENTIRAFRRKEDHWSAILGRLTTTNMSRWEELHKKETYLSPEECLALGLIEEIV